MISHKYKCIFVEVPKTASTSIRSILGFPEKPHLDIKEIEAEFKNSLSYDGKVKSLYYSFLNHTSKQVIGTRLYKKYFKFGFVRNPWCRTVSLYHRKQGIMMADKMTFEEFVDWINYSSDTCIHPSPKKNQLDWFLDENGNVAVDFIGKFERLQKDWQFIANKLRIETGIPHLNNNGSGRRHYTEYYNEETKAVIAEKFRIDIEYFGYKFG